MGRSRWKGEGGLSSRPDTALTQVGTRASAAPHGTPCRAESGLLYEGHSREQACEPGRCQPASPEQATRPLWEGGSGENISVSATFS